MTDKSTIPAAVPCPFVYANARKCGGHVVRVEAYKADLYWTFGEDGAWSFGAGEPRSHYHVFCSEKGDHAGIRGSGDGRMKFYVNELPESLRRVVSNFFQGERS